MSQNEENEHPTVTIRYVGNDYLIKIVKNYFRSDPYRNEFGFFLKHLMNDPILVNKSTRLRTDTSLFYFQGVYKNYSPYGFLADRTEIRLAEQELVIDDSLSLKDIWQTFYYRTWKYNARGRDRRSNRRLFYSRYGASPLTVAWAKLDESESAFIITLRLKTK